MTSFGSGLKCHLFQLDYPGVGTKASYGSPIDFHFTEKERSDHTNSTMDLVIFINLSGRHLMNKQFHQFFLCAVVSIQVAQFSTFFSLYRVLGG